VAIFVDTNVIVYAAAESAYREPCLGLLRAVAEGRVQGRISTAVLEEAWHVELSGRAGDLTGLARRAYTLFTPLLAVTDEIVAAALDLPPGPRGANDRIHVATCTYYSIDTIASADESFDRARGIRRVDPLDERALARLLGG